ncbi:pectinesterase inhibitor 10-like [Etheostoma spectabile]|uniref:pectinesterase inhibitor 10-like n=1 Tax=Etheostoma spectabile TaxID=54343 RepID=UPI0013AF9156|nr:pectinesterase inhibitor 10-like [Etheostoma spectabile]
MTEWTHLNPKRSRPVHRRGPVPQRPGPGSPVRPNRLREASFTPTCPKSIPPPGESLSSCLFDGLLALTRGLSDLVSLQPKTSTSAAALTPSLRNHPSPPAPMMSSQAASRPPTLMMSRSSSPAPPP